MKADELARLLKDMHTNAPNRDKSLHMTLFAIKYASALENHAMAEISEMAGLGKSGPQLALGRKLAGYVDLK